MISYDQFQSQEAMQELEKAGFPVKYQSVDKTDEAYLCLVDYIYEGKIKFPQNDEFEANLFDLVHFREKRKVDHTCLTGDTLISLVDGRNLTILELLDEQNKGKINWVYSFNEHTKKIEPKPIKDVLPTKIVDKIVKITLDNDKDIYCTLDHKIMTRDGSYIEAKNLQVNQALMPLYTKYPKDGKLTEYRMYYEPIEEQWHFEHRNFCLDDNFSHSVVHHCNFNHHDNTPTNLKRMTKSEHTILHNNLTKDYKKIAKSLSNYHKNNKNTEAYKLRNKHVSEGIKRNARLKMSPEHLSYILKKESYINERNLWLKTNYNLTWSNLSNSDKNKYSQLYRYYKNPQLYIHYENRKPLSKEQKEKISINSSSCKWFNDGEKTHFCTSEKAKEHNWIPGRLKMKQREYKNHKVKSIEFLNVDSIQMYDLSIEDNHNFALTSGVFVHNSNRTSEKILRIL